MNKQNEQQQTKYVRVDLGSRNEVEDIQLVVLDQPLISYLNSMYEDLISEVGDPELIHVIKTGFKNRYMIVHEDAYEFLLGKVEFKTREEIKKIYDIEI